MPSLVFWDEKLYSLEDAVIGDKLKSMHNSINGSNYSATLDCIDAAQTVGEVTGIRLGMALKLGDSYIDMTEESANSLVWESSFDCPSELFREKNAEFIKEVSS